MQDSDIVTIKQFSKWAELAVGGGGSSQINVLLDSPNNECVVPSADMGGYKAFFIEFTDMYGINTGIGFSNDQNMYNPPESGAYRVVVSEMSNGDTVIRLVFNVGSIANMNKVYGIREW